MSPGHRVRVFWALPTSTTAIHEKGSAHQLVASKLKGQLPGWNEKSAGPSKDWVLLTALGPVVFISPPFSVHLLLLHVISLQLHGLRRNLFHLVALSILEGPSTREGRSWALFCFVLFLNSANNRRTTIVCIGSTCFPARGRCFVFLCQPPSPFILAAQALLSGGNFCGSWFLRELPIPGNSESLPRGPLRLLFYCPHPPTTPPYKEAPEHTRRSESSRRNVILQQGRLCRCAAKLCVRAWVRSHRQECMSHREGACVSTLCILFSLQYRASSTARGSQSFHKSNT